MFDLTSKALTWVCGVLMLSLFVAGGFAGCEHHNATAAREQRDGWQTAAQGAFDANDTNVGTIAAYKKSNAALWALIPKAGDVAKQLEQLQAEVDDLNRQHAAYAAAKETDRADPDCDSLLRTDLEHLCPTVALRLRRAAGGN